MNKANNKKAFIASAWVLMIILITAGCSTLSSKGSGTASTTPSSTATVSAPAATLENAPVYYDFGDVMVPRELKIEKGDSFVMNSGGMTSGLLVLRGSVDVNSLVTFFENKMPVDGWRQMGSFRSERSIMLFEKKTRWCVIGITDGRFSTKVEIWVAPTIQDMGTGLRK